MTSMSRGLVTAHDGFGAAVVVGAGVIVLMMGRGVIVVGVFVVDGARVGYAGSSVGSNACTNAWAKAAVSNKRAIEFADTIVFVP